MNNSSSSVGHYKNPDADPRGPYVLTDITAPTARANLSFTWRGFNPPNGRTWRFTAEKFAELEKDGRLVLSGKFPRLKRFLSEVAGHQEPEPEQSSFSTLEYIVRKSMRAIAEAIAENPALLNSVEWRDLERVMREVFESIGFTTRLTRPGKDGGFDLELECAENGSRATYLVEIKHWTEGAKRVGNTHVSSFYDVIAKSSANTGLLLSSSGFTMNAISGRTEAELQSIRLGDSDKIVSMCQSFIKCKSGLWEPTCPLPDVLIHGTR